MEVHAGSWVLVVAHSWIAVVVALFDAVVPSLDERECLGFELLVVVAVVAVLPSVFGRALDCPFCICVCYSVEAVVLEHWIVQVQVQ